MVHSPTHLHLPRIATASAQHQALPTTDPWNFVEAREGWQSCLRSDKANFKLDEYPCEAHIQQMLDELGSGDLTKSAYTKTAKDLLYMAQCLLAEEGCTAHGPYTFKGETKHLNALQLIGFSATLNNGQSQPTPVGIETAWNALGERVTVQANQLAEQLKKVAEGPGTYRDSTQPLSPREQSMAKAVINSFPADVRQKFGHIDAHLIGRPSYRSAMEKAAIQPWFPEALQQVHRAARSCPGIRTAITNQPSVAHALLFPGQQIAPATAPADYAAQMVKKIVPNELLNPTRTPPVPANALSFLDKALPILFLNMKGLGSQNTVQVPSCFEIPCPEHSTVKIGGMDSGVHANVISQTGPGALIAAMQPVTAKRGGRISPANLTREEQTHVANFLRMVASQEKPAVLDLRSEDDLDHGKGFDYCPQKIGNSHQFDDVSITTTHIETLKSGLRQLTVQVYIGQHPPVELKVTQFREWPDHDVVSPATLRMLGQHVCQEKQSDASVITHCSAGVGRTGTVLAYARLYQKLINEGGAKQFYTTENTAEPNFQKLIDQLVTEVLNGRIQRGPQFVENRQQFKLLGKTILEDVQKWNKETTNFEADNRSDGGSSSEFSVVSATASPTTQNPGDASLSDITPIPYQSSLPEITPSINQSSVPEITPAPDQPPTPRISTPQATTARQKPKSSSEPYPWLQHAALQVPNVLERSSNVALHANRIQLIPTHTFHIAQEPKNALAKWQHLHSVFDKGCDVLEFVSDPNRLAHQCSSPLSKGFSILSPLVLDAFRNPARHGGKPRILIGNFRINDIRRVMTSTHKKGCAVYVYQFDVTDTESKVEKSIRHVQMFSEFKDNRFTKDRLKLMLGLADKCELNHKDLWLSSAAGIGRPSAWLMARHISHAVGNKQMTHGNYRQMIDNLINTGREQRSPHFVHTSAQKEALIQLAEDLLKKKAGNTMPEQVHKRRAYPKKSSLFGVHVYSFNDLLKWIKTRLKPAKT